MREPPVFILPFRGDGKPSSLRLRPQSPPAPNQSALQTSGTPPAHRVSGRVAVLSTKMQQDFYTEIADRYNDYVEYLKQVDEYDLEVEAMNLDAETTSRIPMKS